jgi:hypothetical protein
MKFEFARQVFEKQSNAICYENPPSEAEFFHAHGQTNGPDMIKKRSAFRNFANVPKTGISQYLTSPLNFESEVSAGRYAKI